MKNKSLAVLLIVLLPLFVFGQQTEKLHYPSYKEVTTKFIKLNGVPDDSVMFNVEKRKDGWVISLYTTATGRWNPFKKQLFWSLKNKEYATEKLYISTNFSSQKGAAKFKVDEDIELNYNAFPIYGYEGWYLDAIDILSGKTNLSDSLNYCLGRAYYKAGDQMLWGGWKTAPDSLIFKYDAENSALTPEQLKRFRNVAHKAVEYYKKCKDINPKYESIVGSIKLKADHEYLTNYLNLLMFSTPEEAVKEIPEERIYDDFIHDFAYNYLQSCEKNAILFTNGDTDTYALLYLQEKYGIRRDVRVVNMSLLNTARYRNLLPYQLMDSQPIKISNVTESMDSGDYILLVDNKKPYSLLKAMEYLTDSTQQVGTTVNFRMPKNLTYEYNGKKYDWSIEPERDYVYTNAVTIIDILANNPGRPVYFGITVSDDDYIGLQKFFVQHGMAYKVGAEITPDPLQTGEVNADIMYNSLMMKFRWGGVHNLEPTYLRMCMNYRNTFARTANALFNKGDKVKCKAVLDRCCTVFNNTNVPYDYFMIPAAQLYYAINETPTADNIMKLVIKNTKAIVPKDNQENLRNGMILKQVKNIAQQNNRTEIEKLIGGE